jgi:hypothetical protein
MKKQTPSSRPAEPPEKLLHGLLSNTEVTAEKTPFEKKKWQLVSLLMGTLFVIAAAIAVWLAFEMSITATLRNQLEAENQSLREQLTLAGSQIAGLKNELDVLHRNMESAAENGNLKQQGAATSSKSASADTIRKGTYSRGSTKAELIAAMGEPDRIYNSRGYEQLVYFGKKPGRFWLVDGRVVQVGG